MNRTHRWPGIAAALLVAACGPGSKSQPMTELNDDQQPDPGCTGAFSGAATGTFDCYVVTTSSVGAGTVGVQIEAVHFAGAFNLLPAELTWAGVLEPGTVTDATGGLTLYSSVSIEDPAALFLATRGNGYPRTGAFSLAVTRVDAGVPHGTFDAQLCTIPEGCDVAKVTLAVRF